MRRTSRDPDRIIEQSLLAEFHETRRRRRKLEADERILREQCLAAVRDGAIVEPGSLTLRIQEYMRPQLTYGNLRALKGDAWVDRLTDQLPRRHYEMVIVELRRR